MGVSLLPGTKRSSTGSELPFTSLHPLIPPQNFKLKQTVHCLSITSEHQQLFTWVGRQASASPITSLKTQHALITQKSQLAAFSPSSSLGSKGSNIGQLRPRKLLEDSLGAGGIQADESHANPCVLLGIVAAFPPRWRKCCSTAA